MKTLNKLTTTLVLIASIFSTTTTAHVIGDAVESVNDTFLDNFDTADLSVTLGGWTNHGSLPRLNDVKDEEGTFMYTEQLEWNESNDIIGISYKAVTIFTVKNSYDLRGYGAYYTFRLLGAKEAALQLNLRLGGVTGYASLGGLTVSPIVSPTISVKPFLLLEKAGVSGLGYATGFAVDFGVQPTVRNDRLKPIATLNLRYDF